MEVPAGHDGIQRLLAAEQDAQAVVAAARQAKSEKLKKAKLEADREIEAYKREREAAQAQRTSADASAAEETTARLRQDSDQVVANVKKSISSKKEEVLSMLLKHVTSVK